MSTRTSRNSRNPKQQPKNDPKGRTARCALLYYILYNVGERHCPSRNVPMKEAVNTMPKGNKSVIPSGMQWSRGIFALSIPLERVIGAKTPRLTLFARDDIALPGCTIRKISVPSEFGRGNAPPLRSIERCVSYFVSPAEIMGNFLCVLHRKTFVRLLFYTILQSAENKH